MLIFRNFVPLIFIVQLFLFSCMDESSPHHLSIRYGTYISSDSSLIIHLSADSDIVVADSISHNTVRIKKKQPGEFGCHFTNDGPSDYYQYIPLDTNALIVNGNTILRPTLIYYDYIDQRWIARGNNGDSVCVEDTTLGLQIIDEDSLNYYYENSPILYLENQ